MLIKLKSWLRKKILRFLQIESIIKDVICTTSSKANNHIHYICIKESADINKITKEIYELQRRIQEKGSKI